MDQQAEKRQDRKSNRIRQKNKRVDSKVESKDSPEIPDWGWVVVGETYLNGAKKKRKKKVWQVIKKDTASG